MAHNYSYLKKHYSLSEDICNKQVSDEHIAQISGFLSGQWRKLPNFLGLEKTVLSGHGLKTEEEERISFLSKWKKRKRSEATYEVFIKALLDINCRGDAESVCDLLMPQETPSASGDQHDPKTGTPILHCAEIIATPPMSPSKAGTPISDTLGPY